MPALSCHSCALSYFACPIGVFVHYSGYHMFPLFALGMILVWGALLGRLLCGWVCPFGFLQDLLHKIPSRKFELPRWMDAGKYIVLVVMVVAIPFMLGSETQYSFCRICPAAALQVSIPAMFGEGLTFTPIAIVKFVLLAVILVTAVFSSRIFCRVLCPIGAMMGPFNYISAWIVRVPKRACTSCQLCEKSCPVDAQPSSRIEDGISASRSAECIVCHDCQSPCPLNKKGKEQEPQAEAG